MKKITSLIAALAIAGACFAQKPAINTLQIAGRSLAGTDAYAKGKPFTNIGNGDFVCYVNLTVAGYSGVGFKISVNRDIDASTNWNNNAYTALVAPTANVPVSPNGGPYPCLYVGTGQTDTKWILATDQTDGWYKITVHTAELDNVTFDFEAADGSFADLAGIIVNVPGAVLRPAFDPAITSYVCILPSGTTSVTPDFSLPTRAAFQNSAVNNATCYFNTGIAGADAVDVSGGSGVSEIEVTSLDGSTTKTYTINYVVDNVSSTAGGEDKTSLIVNNDFDYVAAGVLFTDAENYPTFPGLFESDGVTPLSSMTGTSPSQTYRPLRSGYTKIGDQLGFYGWELSDWEWLWKDANGDFINNDSGNANYQTSPNESLGINIGSGGAGEASNGSAAWIAGHSKTIMPEDFEFYQTITAPGAGTYRLNALLVVDGGNNILTQQRIFANNSVQFFGRENDYSKNKKLGEIYSYAGYTAKNDAHRPTKVYTTIAAGENLKIGIRSGNMNKNGHIAADAGNTKGWFKMDQFLLTKIDDNDAANANLADITLSAGSLTPASGRNPFSPSTTEYDVELPEETTSITAIAIPDMADAAVTGDGTVNVSSGSAVQNIVVTALDGTTTQTYTINYTVRSSTGMSVIATGKTVKSTSYSTLTGIAAPATAKGLLLKKTLYSDGSIKVEKVLNK
ncbi:MAG: cadherin-like beta sandwich domain-containing protein [Prevotella sp.]|jgi:hypothetical protein|nr:cadherin-like beta sandwich domain-containing protein [Prevotella sp.]